MTKKSTTKTASAATPASTKKPAKTAAPAAAKTTRVASLHQMLSRAGGASVAEISDAFGGWEHHSCRGLISTGRRKLGWNVTTAKADGRGTVYSIASPKAAAKAKASPKAKAAPKVAPKAAKAKPASKRARANA